MFSVIAQIFGIVGMGFNIFSFQCKKQKQLVTVLGLGSFMFSLNFLMLGAFAGAGFNLLNILRSVCILKKKSQNNLLFGVISALYIIVAILTFDTFWTIILLAAQLVATYSLWYRNGNFIRLAQIFCVSPIWLVNNLFVSFSLGGIICEVFTIISVIVSLYRFKNNL